jgi:hypothetical protein
MRYRRRNTLALWTLIATSFCALAPFRAESGRRPFLYTYDSEIVPEGDVELEQWIWAESKIPANPNRQAVYWIWWGPVIGASNHLEIALPFQIAATASSMGLDWISADLRYRFFSREKDGGIQPLLRVAVKQAVRAQSAPSTAEMNLVVTYGRATQLHLAVDLGLRVALPWPEVSPRGRPIFASYSAGLAYPLIGNELRIAAEFYGEAGLQDSLSTRVPRNSVGGSLSWTRGRIWITAGSLFGLTGLSAATPEFSPRLIWGIAL